MSERSRTEENLSVVQNETREESRKESEEIMGSIQPFESREIELAPPRYLAKHMENMQRLSHGMNIGWNAHITSLNAATKTLKKECRNVRTDVEIVSTLVRGKVKRIIITSTLG